MINIFSIIKFCDRIYVSRFFYSGFKGNFLAFINLKKIYDIVKKDEVIYTLKYLKLKEKYSAHICNTAIEIKL